MALDDIPPQTLPLLPELCYTVHPTFNTVVIVKRGESGYYPLDFVIPSDQARKAVDHFNTRMGVTRAQEQAMQVGSCFGWHVPLASPARYNDDGTPR